MYTNSMTRPQFTTGEIYHIYNRGVEKRKIFYNDKDRFRFIHSMFEFNDEAPALNIHYYFGTTKKVKTPTRRTLLVEILSFCLMPNHYHLLVRQEKDNGITLFMRKLGTGYTNYFNKKYKRVGPLFQGKCKATLVHRESHLIYLPHYIHLNPLDLIMPEWRSLKVRNTKRALTFLTSYRWSSYLDYINKHNFPSLINRDLILNLYADSSNYAAELEEWLESIDFEPIQDIVIENPIEVRLR